MKVACSWSGGKDSCLACWKAIAEGHDVRYLINFVSSGIGRDSFHGVKRELMCMQSESLGIPIIQRETTWEDYEQEFKEVMREIGDRGVEGLVTGDLDLVDHRRWVEGMCGEFGFEPVMPLWGLGPEKILGEFVDDGFEAVVVCIKADLLDDKWLGRKIDRQFVADLKELCQNSDIDICGENGEYHSFVVDGPFFQKRIFLSHGAKFWMDGYGFLEIDQASLVQKVG